jgi:hypothetical protein
MVERIEYTLWTVQENAQVSTIESSARKKANCKEKHSLKTAYPTKLAV